MPGWVADVLSDDGKRSHLFDQGHKDWPFQGRTHWKALVRYAYLPAESMAIAAWSFEQRLPNIHPSKLTIMDDSGVSDRAVTMAIDVLKWLGFVDVVHRDGDNNEYFLTFPLVDTTRLITRPDPSITPLHRALKAVVEGRRPSTSDAELLNLGVLTALPVEATTDPSLFAEAWAMFPIAKRGSEAKALRAWRDTVDAMVAESHRPAGEVEAALHRAARWLMRHFQDSGEPTRYIPAAPHFFAPDGRWREFQPGGQYDPDLPPLYVDGVQVR